MSSGSQNLSEESSTKAGGNQAGFYVPRFLLVRSWRKMLQELKLDLFALGLCLLALSILPVRNKHSQERSMTPQLVMKERTSGIPQMSYLNGSIKSHPIASNDFKK